MPLLCDFCCGRSVANVKDRRRYITGLAHGIDLKVLTCITGQAQIFAFLKHSAVLYSMKSYAIQLGFFGL